MALTEAEKSILEDAARDSAIDVYDKLLRRVYDDGLTISSAKWPRLLESLLRELHDIVHNQFPLPTAPPPEQPASDRDVIQSTPPRPSTVNETQPTQTPTQEEERSESEMHQDTQSSQDSAKENDIPARPNAHTIHPSPFEVNHNNSGYQSSDLTDDTSEALPPELNGLYQSSINVLKNDFAHSPPYTIQRLAEMILTPQRHYRFLPSYLRALDRIIAVSSPISNFPLPTLNASLHSTGFLTNGDALVNGATEREGLGSDESLGGALLTPIPWLRNEGLALGAGPDETDMDGLNGHGIDTYMPLSTNGVSAGLSHSSSAPTSPTLSEQSDASSSTSSSSTEAQLRQQGGVTQGELLRQEQEAGLVPVSQGIPRRAILSSGVAAVGREAVEQIPEEHSDDRPVARGPEVIGMEDTGPQPSNIGNATAINLEAAVGRAKSPPTQSAVQIDDASDNQTADPIEMDSISDNVAVDRIGKDEQSENEQTRKDADGDSIIEGADPTRRA